MPETREKKIDKLDRKDYVKFIENLILNSDNYKRDNASKSYVMALDSAWGTGKSYFIDLLIQDIEEQNGIFVVKYNAWANDYCDNAFNPLIYDILNAECLKFSTETTVDAENAKKFLRNIFDIGKSFAKKAAINFIESQTGTNIEEILNEVTAGVDIKEFLRRELPNLSELNEQREAFENLKNYLSEATEWMKEEGNKLVVVIDELDRCKPTFAIQTLEIVKHIFDVDNVVFLFAVDIEQLSHSVSTVYGQEFDSVGYLCRFFDYISKLPNPNIEKFISHKLEEAGFDRQSKEIITVFNYTCELVQRFNLSLRDIDTVMQSYKILNNTKLSEYEIVGARFVYLFYLTLKYKKPDMYYEIFIKKSKATDVIRQLQKDFYFNKTEASYINDSLNALDSDDKFNIMSMDLYDFESTKYKSLRIKSIENNTVRPLDDYYVFKIDAFSVWGNILFYPDLVKWEEICTYTYREDIHKQLENYNFMDAENKGEV